jgi:hypothetical protein
MTDNIGLIKRKATMACLYQVGLFLKKICCYWLWYGHLHMQNSLLSIIIIESTNVISAAKK